MNIFVFCLLTIFPILCITSRRVFSGQTTIGWFKECKRRIQDKGTVAIGQQIRLHGYCEGVLCLKEGSKHGLMLQHCRKHRRQNPTCKEKFSSFPKCCREQLCTATNSSNNNVLANLTSVPASTPKVLLPEFLPITIPSDESIKTEATTLKLLSTESFNVAKLEVATESKVLIETKGITESNAMTESKTRTESSITTVLPIEIPIEAPKPSQTPENNTKQITTASLQIATPKPVENNTDDTEINPDEVDVVSIVQKLPKNKTSIKYEKNVKKTIPEIEKLCKQDFITCLALFLHYVSEDADHDSNEKQEKLLHQKIVLSMKKGNHSVKAFPPRSPVNNGARIVESSKPINKNKKKSTEGTKIIKIAAKKCQENFIPCLNQFLKLIAVDGLEEQNTRKQLVRVFNVTSNGRIYEINRTNTEAHRNVRKSKKLHNEDRELIKQAQMQCKKNFLRCLSLFLSFVGDDGGTDDILNNHNNTTTEVNKTLDQNEDEANNEKANDDNFARRSQHNDNHSKRIEDVANFLDTDLEEPFSQLPDDNRRRNSRRNEPDEPREFQAVEFNFK